ncbi:MAG: hypothetical protein M1835_003725 [Candelina submexicana]|nr:MAG: hypothetical protein M1835_003725 [Candelina submexicana]
MSSPPTQRPFPFLKLPPELRIKVYHYIRVRCFTYFSGFQYLVSTPRDRDLTRGLYSKALLRVSSQIYYEARPYFYRNIRFEFKKFSALGCFLKMVGPVIRANINYLLVRFCTVNDTPISQAFTVLALCSNLINLEVKIALWMFETELVDEILNRVEKLDEARRAWGLKKTEVTCYC